MNMNFKLGKVMIPVPQLADGIIIEGLEVSVSDYNLMEGLKVLKELPGILFELRQVMEVDLDEAMASAADEQDEKDFMQGMLDDLMKKTGAIPVNHPIHGKGMAIPKDNPLLKAFLKHEEAKNGGELPKDLKDMMGGKLPWEKPELKEVSLGDLLGKLGGGKMDLGPLGKLFDKEA